MQEIPILSAVRLGSSGKTEPQAGAGGVEAPKTTAEAQPQSQTAPAQPGRGCLAITADHPYSLKDMRFDEAAQALAHATGCFIRYDDQNLSALKIAPVEGRMSIRDAVQKSLEGSAYAVTSATDSEIVVGKKAP
nr:STN domain-containing protein [uncultured Sutterella sp.]